jgi:Ca-activated chloride channel family protein
MDLVALAGQGSRRRLESRSEAASLVDQQLASAARVVARAVRLRIRLAPGVRLVEVVGSRPLAEPQAQRVREAERSIDLRLSRNLGIEADRGEDEDGIQIVIPSFQAADAHAILLDVVAPGPGPIAEVTARYKDIVALRNGVARASLRLEDGIRTEGPLERNVFRNRLALRLSRTLERAGERLRAGDPAEAVRVLEEARALRRGLAVLRPPLAGDPELGRDVAMLGEYVRLLRGVPVANPEDQVRLADSLTYAGHLKVLPRPTPVTAPGV